MSKKKKELGLDGMGIQKTMRKRDYLADGSGQLALNLMSGIVGQMIYFYTDKVGLAAGAVGTMLLFAKIIDAFTCLIAGKVFDSKNYKGSQSRSWFIVLLIPMMITMIAMFTVPNGASTGIKMAYVLITNVLLIGLVFTFLVTPYGALLANRTRSVEERSKMGIVRAILGYVSGMILAIGIIPITNLLGGNQAAWIKLGVGCAIFAAIAILILYFNLRKATFPLGEDENVNLDENGMSKENIPFFEALNKLFHNKYWVLMLLVNAVTQLYYALNGATGAYYAKWILGDDNLVGIMGAVGLIPTFLGFASVTPLAKKFGPVKACRICLMLSMIAGIIRIFFPYSFMATLVLGAVGTFAIIPLMCLTPALSINCIEYNEWKFGVRMVGMGNSASSFGGTIASGLGSSITGWILAIGAYNALATTQPTSAIYSILTLCIYLPLAFTIILYFLLGKYDLDKIYPTIIKELNERKAANNGKKESDEYTTGNTVV